MTIDAFKIAGTEVSWSENHVQITNGDPSYEDLYLSKDAMNQIAIQWLCLHDPSVIRDDSMQWVSVNDKLPESINQKVLVKGGELEVPVSTGMHAPAYGEFTFECDVASDEMGIEPELRKVSHWMSIYSLNNK